MVLPILLLLILGLINLGVMVNAQIILTQAVWEGARSGATLDPASGAGDEVILGAVRGAVAGLDPDKVEVDIEPTASEFPRNQPGPEPRGRPLRVRVEYPLTLTLPFPVVLRLRAEATSRIEYTNPP